jgi:hypothetical protein
MHRDLDLGATICGSALTCSTPDKNTAMPPTRVAAVIAPTDAIVVASGLLLDLSIGPPSKPMTSGGQRLFGLPVPILTQSFR